MKLGLKLIGGLIVVLILTAFLVPMFVSGAWLKSQVESQATEAVGRSVTLGGEPSISLLPPRVKVDGLTVANADGFSAPHFIDVEAAQVGVKLFPLFGGKVEITEFILDTPDINLEVAEDGTANWVLSAEQAETTPTDDGSLPVQDISLGDVRIKNGSVSFDNGSGTTYQAEDANLTLSLASLAKPLIVKGSMVLQGDPATIDAELSTPRKFLENETAELDLTMTVGKNKASTVLNLSNPIAFNGSFDVDVPALRALIALSGQTIEAGPESFEKLRLKGNVEGDLDTFAFAEGTELTLDDISGTGNVTIELSGNRPMVSGSISTEVLDLRRYLPEAAETPAAGAAFPAWSSEQMDFSALRSVDVDLDMSTGKIVLPMMEIGQSSVDVQMTAGRATATLKEASFYGGTGTGTVVLDARAGRQVSLAPNLVLSNVDVGAAAKDLANVNRLLGNGNLNIDLSTSGASQAAWVDNLNGTISVAVADGTIEGVNLGKLARGALQAYNSIQDGGVNIANITQTLGQLTTTARGDAEQTDFNQMDVAMTFRSGTGTSDTISVVGPFFAVTGDGEIDLPNQSMRMRLEPSASSADGEAVRKLPAPILVSGTFNEPKIGFDTEELVSGTITRGISSILKNQGIDVPDGADNVGDLVGGTAREELGKLLGRSNQEEAPSEDGAENQADDADVTDELLKLGVGALFGGKEEETSEDE